VNSEQREKPPNDGALTQEAIDRAFRNQPRHTKLIYELGNSEVTILNGKNTNRLGVKKVQLPNCGTADVTSLERALIDIAVRPNYADGVFRVVDAFVAARGRFSVSTLVRTLKALDYTYPYHQAIGFYLKQAGYSAREWKPFARIGARFDFYLSHGISGPILDREWRVFYPTGLNQRSAAHA